VVSEIGDNQPDLSFVEVRKTERGFTRQRRQKFGEGIAKSGTRCRRKERMLA
jgi:hypothetical protein